MAAQPGSQAPQRCSRRRRVPGAHYLYTVGLFCLLFVIPLSILRFSLPFYSFPGRCTRGMAEPDGHPGYSGGLKRRREHSDGDVDSADEPSEFEGHVASAASIYDVLQKLQGAHRQGSGFLGFLSTADAAPLRSACREFRGVVADFPWDSFNRFPGSLRLWRACFPCATAINICYRKDLSDADFVNLRGIHTLNMSGCDQEGITDTAFAHLTGIRSLIMSSCNQAGITDAAFAHLRGIQGLDMSDCDQAGITDAAFTHLEGIRFLNMNRCVQAGITDAAFAYLSGIQHLFMKECRQEGITDAAFAHLRGIKTLDMAGCRQETISDAAFAHLSGIHTLDMGGCDQPGITDAAFAHLRGIHTLDIWGCDQEGITDAAFVQSGGHH